MALFNKAKNIVPEELRLIEFVYLMHLYCAWRTIRLPLIRQFYRQILKLFYDRIKSLGENKNNTDLSLHLYGFVGSRKDALARRGPQAKPHRIHEIDHSRTTDAKDNSTSHVRHELIFNQFCKFLLALQKFIFDSFNCQRTHNK